VEHLHLVSLHCRRGLFRLSRLRQLELADQHYEILKTNPRHPSLHLKKLGGIGQDPNELPA
jgi:hypothetical protein